MKKLKLFISLWFTMFSVAVFAQAEFEKIAITQNTQDNLAGRLLVQDVTTGEIRYILKSVLDNKFNQPTGNATQYLDGAGNPTTFPVLGQSDRVITEVRNTTGATVTKGTVVYLTGASGGKPTIQKAQANAESTSSGTFGVIQSDINNNSNGYVVVIGTVLGVNTSSYSEGQILWLSPTTAGGFTTTKPVAPNHAVYVAIVTLASTQGTIEVKIQNGYEIDELHDVLIVSKTDNDGLIYDAASGLWKNKQITKSMVGLGNVDNTSDVNKPISTATQNALNLKENTANKNIANGYAGLGSDGKLFSNQLPSITITDTFVVGSQAAMLALTAETGDVAVRTDLNKSYILKGTDPAVLANWQELLTPTSAVTSVFGRNGAVTAQNGDYTTALVTETTNKRYQTDIQQAYNDATSSIQTQINSKANDNAVVHLAGSESVTGAKKFTATPSFDSNIYLKHLSSWSNPADYTVIGGRTDGFLLSASSTKTALIGLGNLTQAWTYDFPNKSGTFAMTSDVPTISGTTNYVTKFTGTSTLGNSQIFDNGTYVGIGTATPNVKLDVVGIGNFNNLGLNRKWVISANDGVIQHDYLGSIETQIAFNGGTTFFTGQKVGIGTPSPSALLNIKQNTNNFNGGLRIEKSNDDTSLFLFNNGSKNIVASSYSSTGSYMPLSLQTSDLDRIYITSGGNIGLRTNTPESGWNLDVSGIATMGGTAGNGRLYVSTAGTTNGVTYLQARNLTVGTPMAYLASSHSFDNDVRIENNAALNLGYNQGGGATLKYNSNGNLDITPRTGYNTVFTAGNITASSGSVTATGFFQSSDLRLKDIISRDGDVIKYKWKDKRDDKIHIGYVAQEVQKENPDQVNADDKGILSVNYIEILVQKIKDLENRIKQLEK